LALKEVGDQEKEAGQMKRCSARSPAFTDLDEAIEAATSLPFAFQASNFSRDREQDQARQKEADWSLIDWLKVEGLASTCSRRSTLRWL